MDYQSLCFLGIMVFAVGSLMNAYCDEESMFGRISPAMIIAGISVLLFGLVLGSVPA